MFRAIFTNSFGILFSRILGFLRDLMTASALGANIYSDIFFIAFKLPNLFRRIFAEGAFTQVFLPAYAKSKRRAIFVAHIFTLFLSIIITLSLLVTILPNFAAQVMAFGFSDEIITIASPFVAINFWYLPFIFAVTFLASMLQYKKHFATTAFSTALLNVSLISALYLSKDKSQEEIVYYLSFGVVAGGLLQLIVHLIAIKKMGLSRVFYGGFGHIKEKSKLIAEETKRFKKQFFPAMWGNSTAQVSAFLDTWLASFLVAGSISYLYYANRIFQLPLALFAIATSIALFPSVAKYIKNNDDERALFYLKKAFWFLATILTLSTIGGFMLSHEIIYVLFERNAFKADDTANTAMVLKMYMIGLLPFGLQKLFSLWLYAKEQQMLSAKIATISLGSNIIFSLLLIKPFGAAGLAIAGTLGGFIGFFLTIKAFGFARFVTMLKSRNSVYLALSSVATVAILYAFTKFIRGF